MGIPMRIPMRIPIKGLELHLISVQNAALNPSIYI